MDLRNFPDGMSSIERVNDRRSQIEKELKIDLSALTIDEKKLGDAEVKNCEQMFGHVSVPVGLAGPLSINLSSGELIQTYLPLATTEGALVASVNRGCKALTSAGGAVTRSKMIGTTRSIAFKIRSTKSVLRHSSVRPATLKTEQSAIGPELAEAAEIRNKSEIRSDVMKSETEWKKIGEATSNHLKIQSFEIDSEDEYIFLTIACDTGDAMGMNMVTIAADGIGKWLEEKIPELQLITIAGNVDSDKKPSTRTFEKGRGHLYFYISGNMD